MPLAQATVGPIFAQDGASPPGGLRQGKLGSLVVHELHGRFYEQVYRGNAYSIGMTVTALSATTIVLTATSTPILAVWNPATSPVNLVMLQCTLVCAPNTLSSPIAPGALVWASSLSNSAITTGSAPLNRKTLANAGSQAKAFAVTTALTGQTNALVVQKGSAIPAGLTGVTYGALATTAFYGGFNGVENFDGSVIVPPGGIWALLNTTSSTTFSVSGDLLWEEVPL